MNGLPPGWALATLDELGVDARPGFPSGRHNADGRGVTHLRPMNINRAGELDLSETKFVETDRDLRVRAGDVLFNNTNSPALVGKTAHVGSGEFAFSNHMTRLRAPDGLSPRYLAAQLHFLWSIGFFTRVLVNHVNQASVSTKPLLATAIAVPPLAEQQRIVAAIEEQFSRLDAADAALERALTKADRLRAQVLDEAMTEGEWVKVGDVSEIQGGIQKQPKRRPVENRFPFLRVANVLRNRLDLTDVHEVELFGNELERLRLEAGDLLVVEGNGSVDQIGRSAVWNGEIPNCVHQNHLIRVRPGPTLDSRYMNLYWNAPRTAAHIASLASSTSGLYTLSVSKISSIPIRLPPLEEQHRIVAEVERQLSIVDATRAAIDRALERSGQLRRSILERAFTGKLVPQDPDDEPASVLLERIRAERATEKPVRSGRRRRRDAGIQ